jgi:hypothetical protein
MFRDGIFDGKWAGKDVSRRRRNGKTGFGVQRREIGREKGGFSSRFPVNFPFFFRPVSPSSLARDCSQSLESCVFLVSSTTGTRCEKGKSERKTESIACRSSSFSGGAEDVTKAVRSEHLSLSREYDGSSKMLLEYAGYLYRNDETFQYPFPRFSLLSLEFKSCSA